MNILNENIIVFLLNLAGIFLAFWVYFANRQEKINQIFTLFVILTLTWIDFGRLANLAQEPGLALFFIKLTFAIACFWFAIYYYFVENLYLEKERARFLDRIVFLIGIFLFILTISTSLIINKIELKNWGINPILGNGKIIFYLLIGGLTLLIIGRLIKKYISAQGKDKLKIQYFLFGTLIYGAFNITFNVFLPTIQGDYQYYQFGNYSAILLLGFTAYAIVKGELFGIRVILTQAFVGVIAILLLLQAFISTNWLEFTWKFGLFLAFIYFGYLLFKSVVREIQQRQEIERLSNAKTEFISIASHQLRTPLTAVKGYISMILEGSYGKIPEKARSPMEKVYQQNDKLVKLVNDLLSLSRIESGKLQLEMQMASMEDLINSIVDIFAIQAKDKNLYLKFEKPKEQIPLIMMDADKNRQVISNIINNCLKYTEKGGVTIKLKTLNGKLQIEISDTGLGMAEAELGKLFQSFSRGEAGARMDAGGAGLGLHIAKKFIEMQKGRVWAESAGKGKGSQFYIELPINNHNNHK
jgi:signal transduction histidine kinase